MFSFLILLEGGLRVRFFRPEKSYLYVGFECSHNDVLLVKVQSVMISLVSVTVSRCRMMERSMTRNKIDHEMVCQREMKRAEIQF